MKINKENIKQILLTCIAFLLIFVGYFNYSLDNKTKEIEVSAETNDINLGDVQLVSSIPVENDVIVSNDNLNEINIENTNISTDINDNCQINENYFEETKIEREKMYSEMIETYEELIDNQETPPDQKAIAAQEISNITKNKNAIMIAENLIKNKGFEDVVILINNEIVSVVVKSTRLNQEQISQIQNIIQRELNTKISNINISNK